MLVSEVMLQQTQVARVEAPYRAFLERFPSPPACARAPVGDVVRAWGGLGYNRRAVQLHGAATAAVERHGGRIPGDLDALMALPGVGPYTARAVLAFAFERDVAVVDVNVARVLARAVVGAPLTPAEGQRVADTVKAKDEPWLWNQSLLELGALVCTARAPSCATCPVAQSCRWAAADRRGPDPASTKRPQSAFVGSDRQGRGRLLAALRSGPVRRGDVAAAAGWAHDPERARRVAQGLVHDGLAGRGPGGMLRLP